MGGIGLLFEYETQKIVQINSTKVGVINRLIQLLIIGYIVCWVMIYEKGYQDSDTLISAVTTKVKGIGFTNLSHKAEFGIRSWDVADYVYPAQENNAIFVMSNIIITAMQSPGKCRESHEVSSAKCTNDLDCVPGSWSVLSNGAATGKCINNSCEVYAWCPIEIDSPPIPGEPLFPMVENFTILIKNDIEFPKYKVKRRNVLEWSNKKFLYNCRYDPDHPEHRYCPIIKLGTIFKIIGASKKLLVKGGVVGINIDWNCNLDWDVKFCNPQYSFRRLDNENANIAKGLNFRYASYYRVNGTLYRDLYKTYGIRFLIFVNGKAGKFHFIPLTMNLGSGLALLGLASVLCDLIVLHVLGSKDKYRTAKYETIENKGQLFQSKRAKVDNLKLEPNNNETSKEFLTTSKSNSEIKL